jgi:hypothetical protein
MNFQPIEYVVNHVKGLASAYFKDQSIALAERWDTFTKAPNYLKNDFGNMCSTLDEYFGQDVVMYAGNVHIEKGERHSTTDILERLEEVYAYLDEVDRCEFLSLSTIKEKILAKNFGFFTYDW